MLADRFETSEGNKQFRLKLYPSNPVKQLLEKLGLRDLKPSDVCPKAQVETFCNRYKDLWGDWNAIGSPEYGNCQSWKNNPGWWKELVLRYSA